MKEKPNEWVAISDLMSGVVAVIMLLLVMAVLQKAYAEASLKKEISKSRMDQKKKTDSLLADLQNSLEKQGGLELVDVNTDTGVVTLKDNVFSRGSACIKPEVRDLLMGIKSAVKGYLIDSRGRKIFVEGHTDNIPVKTPVTDYSRFCTVYDDNYTLSAARAREARKILIENQLESISKLVVVAGYGDSQPKIPSNPEDERNRRVEIHFGVDAKLTALSR